MQIVFEKNDFAKNMDFDYFSDGLSMEDIIYPFCIEESHPNYRSPQDCIRVYLTGHMEDQRKVMEDGILELQVSRIESSEILNLLTAPLCAFPVCGYRPDYGDYAPLQKEFSEQVETVYKLRKIRVFFPEALELDSETDLGLAIDCFISANGQQIGA